MIKMIKEFMIALRNARALCAEDPNYLGLWFRTFCNIEIWFVRNTTDLPGRKHLFWVFYKYVG